MYGTLRTVELNQGNYRRTRSEGGRDEKERVEGKA
jgi:hypothetical protein